MPVEQLVRIQFEMSMEKVKQLEHLKEQTDLHTRREVFDNALTFFEWGVTQSVNGHLVAAVDEVDQDVGVEPEPLSDHRRRAPAARRRRPRGRSARCRAASSS